MQKFKKVSIALILMLFFVVNANSQTVYITETGKKYHAKNCSLVTSGKKGISLEEAKKKGLNPCKICKIEDIIAEDKKKKNIKKKN